MTELLALTEKFGAIFGVALFIAYKEIPLLLKKRNGKWIDLEAIKNSLDNHLKIYMEHTLEDGRVQGEIASRLEVHEKVQNQINIGIEKEIKAMNESMNENFKTVYGKLDRLAEKG